MFAGAFAILMLLGLEWWLSALFAAAISLCIAYLFLSGQRDQVIGELQRRRQTGDEPGVDEEAEDAWADDNGNEAAAERSGGSERDSRGEAESEQ